MGEQADPQCAGLILVSVKCFVSRALQPRCPWRPRSWCSLCVRVAPALAGASYSVGRVVRLAGYSPCLAGASGTCDQSYLFSDSHSSAIVTKQQKKDPGLFHEKHHPWRTVGVYLPPCSAAAALTLLSWALESLLIHSSGERLDRLLF